MIEETPSPARAGRLLSSSLLVGGRQRLDPELAGVEAAGEVAQQEERLGQHVIARHRLELGNVERRQDRAQRHHAGRAVGAAGAGRRHDGVAGVEQHGAAVLHVGVDARQRCGRRLRRARHDRPVDQREERKLVARDVEADRLAGFERGALREEQRQALQAGLADAVDLGVAGDRHRRAASRSVALHGEVLIGRRRGCDAGGARCGGGIAAPLLLGAVLRERLRAERQRRDHAASSSAAAARAGACAGSGRCRRRGRTPPARRARAAPAPRAAPARADPAARRPDRPRAAR